MFSYAWRVFFIDFIDGVPMKCTIDICDTWDDTKELLSEMESQGIDAYYEQTERVA